MLPEERIRWRLHHAREAEGAIFCCDVHEARNDATIDVLEWVLEDADRTPRRPEASA